MPSVLDKSPNVSRQLQPMLVGLGVLAGAALLVTLVIMGQVRLAFAVVVIAILLGLARINVYWAILGSFGFLTILGDFRRWIMPFEEWSSADPLLVVGPVVAIVLWVVAITSRRVSLDTPLSKWILVLMAIMTAHIFNPLQGGLMVGIVGAVFMLVPLLWYWVGKSFGSEEFLETFFFRLIVPLACLAALFGFYQVFFGYPEYQLEWWRPREHEMVIGHDEDTLRPLSFFPNISEYTRYLTVALLACAALVLKKRSVALASVTVVFLFISLVVSGVRGPVVFSLFSIALMWTILGRSVAVWVPRLAVAGAIGLFGLTFGLTQVQEGAVQFEGTVQTALDRQTGTLEGTSGGTIAIHLNLINIAVYRTTQQPLGRGTGYSTMAAGRFGDGGWTSEKDFTDMFIAFGIPGGVVYLIILAYTGLLAVRYWLRERSTIGLIVIGVLVFGFMGWIQPGQYVMTPIIWFCVGALDRMNASKEKTKSMVSTE